MTNRLFALLRRKRSLRKGEGLPVQCLDDEVGCMVLVLKLEEGSDRVNFKIAILRLAEVKHMQCTCVHCHISSHVRILAFKHCSMYRDTCAQTHERDCRSSRAASLAVMNSALAEMRHRCGEGMTLEVDKSRVFQGVQTA